MTALQKALERERSAQKNVSAVLKRHFSPGTRLYWKMGEHFQRGEVIYTGGQRIKVHNDRTGREYLINADRIVED